MKMDNGFKLMAEWEREKIMWIKEDEKHREVIVVEWMVKASNWYEQALGLKKLDWELLSCVKKNSYVGQDRMETITSIVSTMMVSDWYNEEFFYS